MRHTTTIIEREDGLHGWFCSCGQSADCAHPGTIEQVKKNAGKHKREWAEYRRLLKLMKTRAPKAQWPICFECDKEVIPPDGALTYNSRSFHHACFMEVQRES